MLSLLLTTLNFFDTSQKKKKGKNVNFSEREFFRTVSMNLHVNLWKMQQC